MGFLNHATNNVIIDAVLTERGRELLSRNDNSFSISKFRLGDDEVDYSILEKYGLIIGKEKIEKNTPVFLCAQYPLQLKTEGYRSKYQPSQQFEAEHNYSNDPFL